MRTLATILVWLGLAAPAGPFAPAPLWAQTDSALIRRALALQRAVPLVDGHNDIPWEVRARGHSSFDSLDLAQPQPRLQTDLARLRAGGVGAQFWAAYVPASFAASGAARVALEQIDLVHRMVARYPQAFELAGSAADVERIFRQGKIASLIGIEGGHAIENSLGAVRRFYALGARYMTLTHSNTNDWADAATDSARHSGLTPFGEEVVREMNRLGMLVDLSHVSDSTMADAMRVSEAPVIFSHSSARAIADVPRNVPDEMLRRLARNGGVVMVTFVCSFLRPDAGQFRREAEQADRQLRAQYANDPAGLEAARRAWYEAHRPPRATLAQVADHVDHIREVAGIDHIGLGSDFDGTDCTPEGLDDVGRFPALTAELLRRGYRDADVKKVLGLNLLRVMWQAEAVAARLRLERGPSTATISELDSVPGPPSLAR